MGCYHPIYAREITPDAGDFERMRMNSYFLQKDTELEQYPALPKRKFYFYKELEYSESDFERDLAAGNPPYRFPCRKCIGCRLQHSQEWANRLMMELCYHRSAYFITLTYSDENLPRVPAVDSSTGEILSYHATLVKADFQKFMKRLRFHFKNDKIRYYAAGEYGSRTFRPHYHAIIYGFELNDLEHLRKSDLSDPYFISPTIEKLWPQGFHIIGQVSWKSCAYTARYIMKKVKQDNDFYFEYAGMEPEFQSMSLKPGIGFQYFVDHPDIFDHNYFHLSTDSGGKKMYPPDYFKKLAKKDIELYKKIYDKSLKNFYNKNLADSIKKTLTDKSFSAILIDEEERMEKRLKSLLRNTI